MLMNISAFDIKERYNRLSRQDTVFSYLGSLTHQELNHVLKSLESLLANNYSSRGLKKKLFNLLIEITQNLFNYLKNPRLGGYNTVFVFMTESDSMYKIITGNYLLNTEVAGIKTRIEMINSLNNEELRELYRSILDIGLVSTGGGAGLGFVDLARKSGRKLSYRFEEVDDKFSFFTLEVTFTND